MQPRGTGAEAVVSLARTAIARGLEALAANDTKAARRWLERAHRLVPLDPDATLTLASACLKHDPAKAASLFQTITQKYDVRQAWIGLAAARLRLAGPEAAAEPLAVALSRYAFSADINGLANTIGLRPSRPGWCALRSTGQLEIHRPRPGQDPRAPGWQTRSQQAITRPLGTQPYNRRPHRRRAATRQPDRYPVDPPRGRLRGGIGRRHSRLGMVSRRSRQHRRR